MQDQKPAMKKIAAVFLSLLAATISLAQSTRWAEQRANDWYAQQPWLVGSNYIRHRHQRTGNVASRHVRSTAHRS